MKQKDARSISLAELSPRLQGMSSGGRKESVTSRMGDHRDLPETRTEPPQPPPDEWRMNPTA
eukprot:scaffold674330_cov34-Prasinocladus_malaysianus.AAC.1